MKRRAIMVAVTFLVACATQERPDEKKDYSRELPPGARALELVTDPAEYPDFRVMFADADSLVRAIDESLAWFEKPSSHRHYPVQEFTHERVRQSLQALRELATTARDAREFSGRIVLDFDIYRSVGWDGSGTVLFTAYYQPIFEGSRTPTSRFRFPIYRLPDDLVKDEDGTPLGRRAGGGLEPYPTRAEIENTGLLANRGLELAYLESALDAFIIHVQGSARITLPDDSTMYVGYAGKTDRPYRSVGLELVADGKFARDELSLARIRRYFAEHPEDLKEYLQRNESYVFFVETPPGGPWGSLGVPVTPYRTIATDKSLFPRGAPGAVVTRLPTPRVDGSLVPEPFVALTLDQDTGGAIRSAGRCDIFVGTGPGAERIAGHTQYEGTLYYLLLKDRSESESAAP